MNKNYIANVVNSGARISGKMFNIVPSLEDIDPRFPTLIVGWENVEGKYPDVSILNWKISDNLYWTHHKNVKRTRYEADLKKFKELAIERLSENVSYYSFCIMTVDPERVERMFSSLSDSERKYCYITDNSIFVYYKNMGKVVGISLDEAEYIGYRREDIVNFIKTPSNRMIYNDYDIPFDIKSRDEYQRYMVPYLIELFDNE